jgi:hypothetical protein
MLNGHRSPTPRPFVLIAVQVNSPTCLTGYHYGSLLEEPVAGRAKLRVYRAAENGRDLEVPSARESEKPVRGEWTWWRRKR